MSSWRVMNSVIVYMSLVCGPPRFRYPSLRCVVVTFRVWPSHSPLEKPLQLCGAYAGGRGRPSMKIGRFSERMYCRWNTRVSRVSGSCSFRIRAPPTPRHWWGAECGRHWYSGVPQIDSGVVSARNRPASLKAMPR